MHDASRPVRLSVLRRRGSLMVLSLGIAALVTTPFAIAQYTFNPRNADEQTAGIRYFGSAKDNKGSLVPDVSIRLETPDLEYVLVTDEQGRFNKMLEANALPELVSVICSKPGFQLVRVTKRSGSGARPSVQVDCVIRRTAAK